MIFGLGYGQYTFQAGEVLPELSFSRSAATVSEGPARWGSNAFEWAWRDGGGALRLNERIGFEFRPEGATSNALSTFMVWIYNPEPREDSLRVQFGRKGQDEPDVWFNFGLNFSGWRACWVPFERDMQGKPHPDMDYLEFVMQGESGALRFDMLALSHWLDSRHAAPDYQQPFVFDKGRFEKPLGIWDGLMYFNDWALEAEDRSSGYLVSEHTREAISQRLEKALGVLNRNPVGMSSLESRFLSWFPVGERPYTVFYPSQRPHLEALGIEVDKYMRDLGQLLEDVAIEWRVSDDPESLEVLENMASRIWAHVQAEGWDVGSGLGALHHLGYSMREIYRGLFLMRDYFARTGESPAISHWIRWYSGSGRVFGTDQVRPSIDTFNTQTQGMLIGFLMDPDLLVDSLNGFRDWLEWNIKPSDGIGAIFKTDGSIFHHRGHYPAYADGGFLGIAPLVYALAGSDFSISEDSYNHLRHALLTYRFNANLLQWPISISGRHPTGSWGLNPLPFYWIGLAGPSGNDDALLRAYMRLAPQSRRTEQLASEGFEAEGSPQGFIYMPYAGFASYRVGEALASVRGYSRYLWSHETYVAANLYGRYLAHGHIEIMHRGDPVSHAESGFRPEGWDWNRLPGTTTRILPWEKLRADVLNLDNESGFEEMLLSSEAVLGGLAWDESTGIFMQSLRGHAKYNDELRSRKSVYFIDGKIIALGSGIKDTGNEFPVNTTLWQIAVDGGKPELSRRLRVHENEVKAFNGPDKLGYVVFGPADIQRERGLQQSPDQRNDEPTEGFFDKAYIDHGHGPDGDEYLFGMDLAGDTDGFNRWVSQIEAGDWMEVHRSTDALHHVEFKARSLTAMAVFEPTLDLGHAVIKASDKPVVLWIKPEEFGNGFRLRISDPDLRLYDKDGDQFYGDGRQREVSIYSRPWAHNKSQAERISLRLSGHWRVTGNDSAEIVLLDDGDSILSFAEAASAPVDVVLKSIVP
jgi:chondroitin-sulfate-ABC endolyase/exolyase